MINVSLGNSIVHISGTIVYVTPHIMSAVMALPTI